jgi:hypothetical protein
LGLCWSCGCTRCMPCHTACTHLDALIAVCAGIASRLFTATTHPAPPALHAFWPQGYEDEVAHVGGSLASYFDVYHRLLASRLAAAASAKDTKQLQSIANEIVGSSVDNQHTYVHAQQLLSGKQWYVDLHLSPCFTPFRQRLHALWIFLFWRSIGLQVCVDACGLSVCWQPWHTQAKAQRRG